MKSVTRVETVAYGGWDHCLRLFNDEIDLVVTLEVGPRIIRCGFIGEKNVFVEYPDQMGKKNESVYHSYGGHRLWVAPEERPRTYFPDNKPVDWKQQGEWISLRPPVEESTSLQKEVQLNLDPNSNMIRVVHRITNRGRAAQTVAAWALSVMAPGGRAIIPQESYRSHSEHLLPVRPLVFWGYTDMTDPRWRWGKKYILLYQDREAKTPQKIGALNTAGWAAYVIGETVFLKKFPCLHDAHYPDFGSNCEFFTNAKMLELESLSPLVTLRNGESVTHEEEWNVFRNAKMGETEDEIEAAMAILLKRT